MRKAKLDLDERKLDMKENSDEPLKANLLETEHQMLDSLQKMKENDK